MIKNIIHCPVCSKKININIKNEKGILCINCKCLINLSAKNYNYKTNGGQNIPNKKKRLERIQNAKLRFDIINKFIKKRRDFFIDIGCGSGEMLKVGKIFFKKCIGFEHSKELNKYYERNNLKVFNRDCSSSFFFKYKKKKFFFIQFFSCFGTQYKCNTSDKKNNQWH